MPKEGYETAYCSHDAYVKVYQNAMGWYVCYFINYPDSDQTLTFGPMQDEQKANSFRDLLRDTYCEIREQWSPPFEFDEDEEEEAE